jgi:hypothetical protein
MRIPSGVVDQLIYFVAVDSTDLKTRETGISSWTVYRSRNGGTATAYTTPTITEVSSSNMPGVYKFLLDEDMTLDAGDQSQEVCLHITATGVAPVTRVFEIYRPSVTAGETIGVSSGAVSNVTTTATASSVTAVATDGITAGSIAADAIGASELAADAVAEIQSGLATASVLDTVAGYLDTEITAILEDTGTTLPAQIAALNNLSAAAVNAEVDTAISDAFTFTVSGQVDSNVQYVNDVEVTGDGGDGSEWGPA